MRKFGDSDCTVVALVADVYEHKPVANRLQGMRDWDDRWFPSQKVINVESYSMSCCFTECPSLITDPLQAWRYY